MNKPWQSVAFIYILVYCLLFSVFHDTVNQGKSFFYLFKRRFESCIVQVLCLFSWPRTCHLLCFPPKQMGCTPRFACYLGKMQISVSEPRTSTEDRCGPWWVLIPFPLFCSSIWSLWSHEPEGVGHEPEGASSQRISVWVITEKHTHRFFSFFILTFYFYFYFFFLLWPVRRWNAAWKIQFE